MANCEVCGVIPGFPLPSVFSGPIVPEMHASYPLLSMAVAGTLQMLLRRTGLRWHAPRAPQQSSGRNDTIGVTASSCSSTILRAQSPKWQGSEEGTRGRGTRPTPKYAKTG